MAVGSDVTHWCCTEGAREAPWRALELVQATLYLQRAECGAEVSTGSAASHSPIRESVAVTELVFSHYS